jgi:uncharacterized membrane protein
MNSTYTLASSRQAPSSASAPQPELLPEIPIAAAVAPYGYNPSRWSQRFLIAAVAAVAVLISTHLALFQWGLIQRVWDPVFGAGSERVLKSDVAQSMYRWLGIHDAALGAMAYLADAMYALAGSQRRWCARPWIVLLFGLVAIPLGIVGAILVSLQAFLIGHWCLLCLIAAGLSLVLAYLAWPEVSVTVRYLWRVRKRVPDSRTWFAAIAGSPDASALAVAREMLRRPD